MSGDCWGPVPKFDPDCCYRGCDNCKTYHKDQTGTTTTSESPKQSQNAESASADK